MARVAASYRYPVKTFTHKLCATLSIVDDDVVLVS